jgi:hypothetical protein
VKRAYSVFPTPSLFAVQTTRVGNGNVQEHSHHWHSRCQHSCYLDSHYLYSCHQHSQERAMQFYGFSFATGISAHSCKPNRNKASAGTYRLLHSFLFLLILLITPSPLVFILILLILSPGIHLRLVRTSLWLPRLNNLSPWRTNLGWILVTMGTNYRKKAKRLRYL